MNSVLIDRLVNELGFPRLDESNFEGFVNAHEHSVLFFTEDPRSFPESNDVAVILPELIEHFAGRLVPAIIARESERALMKRYGFRAWPALVFLRNGKYLGAITRVQDWTDYLEQIEQMLSTTPSHPPVNVGIPVVIAGQAGGCGGHNE